MLDLFSYFDGMSKSLLRDVHAKAYGKKGLLNNALIQSEVMSYFSDKNRAAEKFAAMEPWQRRTLNLIYHRDDLLRIANRENGGAHIELLIPEAEVEDETADM